MTAPVLELRRAKPLTQNEFTQFQRLIHAETGIFLAEIKKSLLVGRLAKRLRELQLLSFGQYFQKVVEDPAEKQRLFDAICTNETHFFREPHHFDYLQEHLFPLWEHRRRVQGVRKIRVWSAACSSGEEPYSLAMALLTHFPAHEGWEIDVAASDLSLKVLAKARDGLWPVTKADEIPTPYLKSFMQRGMGGQSALMRAGDELRSVVRFSQNNLQAERYAVSGLFDAIFCRNVLIYFDAETRQKVISKLLNHLAGDGYLFLGHSESLVSFFGNRSSSERDLHSVAPAVYRLGASASRRPEPA